MGVKTYSPKDINLTMGGVDITGFADGTFLTIARENPLFSKVVSADGKEVARARNDDRSGTAELTLLHTADSNVYLDSLRRRDERFGDAVVTFKVSDRKSGVQIFSGQAWVGEIASVEYGKEIGERQWVIQLASIDYELEAQSGVWEAIVANVSNFLESVF